MNDLMIFDYEDTAVRVVDIDGEPWWVLKDVCTALELTNPTMVADRLDEDEVRVLNSKTKSDLVLDSNTMSDIVLDIPNRGLIIISESGLYSVIFRSDKPEAQKFRRWVTHEVLPSIRKTGGFQTQAPVEPHPANYPPKASSIREIVELGRFVRELMKDQAATPYEVADAVIDTVKQFGASMPGKLLLPVRVSNLDKLRNDELDMVEFKVAYPESQWEDYLMYRTIMKSSR